MLTAAASCLAGAPVPPCLVGLPGKVHARSWRRHPGAVRADLAINQCMGSHRPYRGKGCKAGCAGVRGRGSSNSRAPDSWDQTRPEEGLGLRWQGGARAQVGLSECVLATGLATRESLCLLACAHQGTAQQQRATGFCGSGTACVSVWGGRCMGSVQLLHVAVVTSHTSRRGQGMGTEPTASRCCSNRSLRVDSRMSSDSCLGSQVAYTVRLRCAGLPPCTASHVPGC